MPNWTSPNWPTTSLAQSSFLLWISWSQVEIMIIETKHKLEWASNC